MPICRIAWEEGRSKELKKDLREKLVPDLAKAANTPLDKIWVCFENIPQIDMPKNGAIVEVLISIGRTDVEKDEIVKVITDAITEFTEIIPTRVLIFITDIPKGNFGKAGKIVNREGIPSQLEREGKLKFE